MEKQQKVDIRTSKKQVFLVHLKKIVHSSWHRMPGTPYINGVTFAFSKKNDAFVICKESFSTKENSEIKVHLYA